jgi:hypothetical protein
VSSLSNLALLDCAYYGRFCQWNKRPALCPVPEIGGWLHDRDCEITVKGKTYKIKRGDQTNLGTVPAIFRSYVSAADPAFVLGFIWHDRLCGEFEEPLCSWSEANQAMYWINKEMSQHLGWWARCKRHLVFVAVELNGLIKGHY